MSAADTSPQVFQSFSPRRWQRFVWGVRAAVALMLYSLCTGQAGPVLGYYLAFLLVDAAAAALAFGFEGEHRSRLWGLLPQRFVYRQLMYVVLLRPVLRAVKGELQSWGVLRRTGNVAAPVSAELTARHSV